LNRQLIPKDPEEKVKLWLSMLEMVKAQISAGLLTSEWGINYDLSGGYGFSELSVPDVYGALSQWVPYVEFDVKPVLTADQAIESLKKVAAAAK
jgi:hypothetical protein